MIVLCQTLLARDPSLQHELNVKLDEEWKQDNPEFCVYINGWKVVLFSKMGKTGSGLGFEILLDYFNYALVIEMIPSFSDLFLLFSEETRFRLAQWALLPQLCSHIPVVNSGVK